ncbi:MAG: cell wall surface anchor family protein [Bacteroidetes bacterium]|nr:MAG: cell wall surface anchor family protein [Bacteroidota bacterium]
MKKLVLFALFGMAALFASAQCTTTNATSCQCQTQSQTDCYLYPDITVSWQGILSTTGGCTVCGYIEYSQTSTDNTYSQGYNAGRLRVSASTPNIGHGPLTVRGVDSLGYRHFVCGTDTFSIYDPNSTQQFTCPNGNPSPHQIVFQRIYHKMNSTMGYLEREAGTMTYHPTHGHNHVDDWGVFTLRIDNGDPNPLNWPIVGQGQKMGFCLMDYSTCSGYTGHCRDDNTVYNQGNTLLNGDFDNYGLGGGNYGCSQVEQGISAGYTDVYGKHLDGMWINIPPGTCNGNYYIVIDVDPNDNFQEENEGNNYTAVPVTLTQQVSSNPIISISASQNTTICSGENITLTASAGTAFAWSTGATSQSITVNQPGTYSCTVTTFCGSGVATFEVYAAPAPVAPALSADTVIICTQGSATFNANVSSGTVNWYDGSNNLMGTGTSYTTPTLSATTSFYAVNILNHTDTTNVPPYNSNIGSGAFVTSSQYNIFNAYSNLTIVSAELENTTAGNVTIQLQDSSGGMLQTTTVALANAGVQRVPLNFSVPAGNNYRLAVTSLPSGGLYRNNGGVSYPYDIPGVFRFTGSSNGAASYYYLYNLELATTNETCTSAATEAVALVDPCLGLGADLNFQASLQLVPNPNNGQFSLNFTTAKKSDMMIYVTDLAGRGVYTERMNGVGGKVAHNMDLSSLAKGVYVFNVVYEGKPYTSKLVIR